MAKIYYEADAPIDVLKDKKVAVIGYGSQGHAHSQNLRDSGIEVAVAELEGTDNFNLAKEHGFTPSDIKTAMDGAALIIVTLPDEMQSKVYEGQIVGEHCRDSDITVNVVKQKALTNMRSSTKDATVTLKAPKKMELEVALEYIDQDELVELTPLSIRLRKRFMKEVDRRRQSRQRIAS